jgi:hypothetical protein
MSSEMRRKNRIIEEYRALNLYMASFKKNNL